MEIIPVTWYSLENNRYFQNYVYTRTCFYLQKIFRFILNVQSTVILSKNLKTSWIVAQKLSQYVQ